MYAAFAVSVYATFVMAEGHLCVTWEVKGAIIPGFPRDAEVAFRHDKNYKNGTGKPR